MALPLEVGARAEQAEIHPDAVGEIKADAARPFPSFLDVSSAASHLETTKALLDASSEGGDVEPVAERGDEGPGPGVGRRVASNVDRDLDAHVPHLHSREIGEVAT